MTPWYKGFTGEIVRTSKGYDTKGTYNVDLVNNKLRITELPIGKWTKVYKTYLETLIKSNIIDEINEYHKSNSVDFEIIMSSEKLANFY